jgi:hypothetical protein
MTPGVSANLYVLVTFPTPCLPLYHMLQSQFPHMPNRRMWVPDDKEGFLPSYILKDDGPDGLAEVVVASTGEVRPDTRL